MKPKSGAKSPGSREIAIGDLKIFELLDVAKRLGISMTTARRYVRTGRLLAQKIGTRWMISEDGLREFFLSPYTSSKHKKDAELK